MKWWVYKCNAAGRGRSDIRGDWHNNFNWYDKECQWGNINDVSDLKSLRVGHRVIAQQSDLQEVVGVLEVTRLTPDGSIHLAPLIRFAAVNLRDLKRRYPQVNRIAAFKPGRIQTLYSVTAAEAKALLRLCAVGLMREGVERLFQTKSLWRDVGDLRRPNPRWHVGRAADSWASRLALPPGAVVLRLPSGRAARSDKTLGALQRDWDKKKRLHA